MQGVYITANESESTTVAVVAGHTDGKKHFTTWMQEGKEMERGDAMFGGFQITKSLVLADGTQLSIQAGGSHYCSPRRNLPYQQYESFEIGFPSRVIPEIEQYGYDGGDIYERVPMEVIERFIQKAGGVIGWPDQLVH